MTYNFPSSTTLLSRGNHTGTQSIPTVQGLQAALDAVSFRETTQVTNQTSWTIDVDTTSHAENIGLTGALVINNPVGTPINGQLLWITAVGTASRAISYGSAFEDSTIIKPTTTSGTSPTDIGFRYRSDISKWRCVAVA